LKGIKFIGRNKAIIDVVAHSEIMDDAIDRVLIKEAKKSGEFIPWEGAQVIIEKKRADELQDSNRKKSTKVSHNRSKKRLP
jgi:hypothetical protein